MCIRDSDTAPPYTVNLVGQYLRVNRIDEFTIQMIIMQLMSGLGDPQFSFKTRMTEVEMHQINESIVLIRDVIRRLGQVRSVDSFHEDVMFILRQLLGNLTALGSHFR